uniref:Ankyrin repeat protein n=1 Tax=uncultured Planctomycetota bacterium TaxID=120965 RepID=A0A1B0Z246_9BACT|nr:ankyrin repeat protein [uncultured Planctomycetota bacterium]
MKNILITIAAVVLVGCGGSQQSAPAPEVKPVEPVAEAAQPKPPTAKAPDISIHDAASDGNIEAVKQHLAAGTDVNAKSYDEWTPLHFAALSFLNPLHDQKGIVELLIAKGADVNAKHRGELTPLHYVTSGGHSELAELLLANGADVNAKDFENRTPLDWAIDSKWLKTAALLRKHGGKTGAELRAAGN